MTRCQREWWTFWVVVGVVMWAATIAGCRWLLPHPRKPRQVMVVPRHTPEWDDQGEDPDQQ